MKKPVNKFAVALWVLAAIVTAAEIAQFVSLLRAVNNPSLGTNALAHLMGRSIWFGLLSALSTPAQLAGLGVIIEFLDQIRWNAQSGRT